jgi:hypothetical protein
MRKERIESLCRNLGRIRRKKSLTRYIKKSNLLSIKISQIKINEINLLKINPRDKTPLEKWGDHQSNVGDENNITYTIISLKTNTK